MPRVRKGGLDMTSLLRQGQHAHPGAVKPHDIRVQHIGVDDDMDDPLHKEELKAYTAVKRAEQAVKDAIRALQQNRQAITANPQSHQKAIIAVHTARGEAAEAVQGLQRVSQRRIEQLEKLAETLGLNSGQQLEGGDGSQLQQDIHRAPTTSRPAAAGGSAGSQSPGSATTTSPSPNPAPTPPSAPKAGETASRTQSRQTRTSTMPKRQPGAMQPIKTISDRARSSAGSIAGHYMDVMSSTPYSRARVSKHGNHNEGYFDQDRKDRPIVDGDLMRKHDTPNSPHSQHMTPGGGDPNELETRRRGRFPTEDAEAPGWLERENQQRARGSFNPDNEPTGPRPLSPLAAARELALNATAVRTKLMDRSFNNDGMFAGYDDETINGDNLKKHEDSHGSTEHHHHGDVSHGHHPVTQYSDDRGVQSHRHASGEALGKPGAINRRHGQHWLTGEGADMSSKTNQALSLARTIQRALTYPKRGIDEDFRENVKLDDVIPTKPVKGVREDDNRTWPEELTGDLVETNVPTYFRGSPVEKMAREMTKAELQLHEDAQGSTEHHHAHGSKSHSHEDPHDTHYHEGSFDSSGYTPDKDFPTPGRAEDEDTMSPPAPYEGRIPPKTNRDMTDDERLTRDMRRRFGGGRGRKS